MVLLPTTSLRVNAPGIACEVMDGEAVLINFEHGIYYSAQGSGGMILERLAAGASAAELIELVQAHASPPASRDEISAGVLEFLQSLLKEALIVEVPAGAQAASGAAAPAASGSAACAPFVRPMLHKYEDLKDLLLLDPIHDTDEAGWPLAPG